MPENDVADRSSVGVLPMYELSTLGTGEGLWCATLAENTNTSGIHGKYRVAVRSDVEPAGSGASAIPPEFESADRSPLNAEVASTPDKQTIDFTLNDAKPGAKSLPKLPE